jgi:hypothetical protein
MKFVMPIQGKSGTELYRLNSNGAGGFYPIGANNSYHGGVHFEGKNLPVVAIADGTIIAYRYSHQYLEESDGTRTYKYSNCFVLIRHEYKTPKGQEFVFYSHYNHLSPWSELQARLTKGEQYPNLIIKPGYEIKTDGLLVRSSAEKIEDKHHNRIGKFKAGQEVVASPVEGTPSWAKREGANEFFSCESKHVRAKPIVCQPQFDQVVSCEHPIKVGAIVGYTGLCQAEGAPIDYAVTHVEVFADDDAEDFINNVKGDGKPTLLKVVKGKELQKWTRKYPNPASALTRITRLQGSEVEVMGEGDGTWVPVKDKRLAGRVESSWLISKYETLPKSKGHFTADKQDVDKLKAQFEGIEIVGEDWTFENEKTETSATKLFFKKKLGSDRVVVVDSGSSAKKYWVRRSQLKDVKGTKEHIADTNECWSENPDEVVVSPAGTVPYECVVPSKGTARDRDVTLYEVEVGGATGWIKESDVKKVNPFNWIDCSFSIIKEESSDGWTLSDSNEDTRIDFNKLPVFFKSIFKQIDTSGNKIIEELELKHAMSKPETAQKLSRMICFHRTEWDDGATRVQKIIDGVKNAFGQKSADNLKTRIQQMCWWNEVVSLPSKTVFHWHPVAFVEHMKELEEFSWAMSPFADLLSSIESRGDYSAYNKIVVVNGVKKVKSYFGTDLTELTIADIQEKQMNSSDMFAVGKYQLIPKTLAAAIKHLGIDTSERYSPTVQDKLFDGYLIRVKRPEIIEFLEGEGDVEEAIYGWAKEFASAGVRAGRKIAKGIAQGGESYYAGDGLNKAHITPDQMVKVLKESKKLRR